MSGLDRENGHAEGHVAGTQPPSTGGETLFDEAWEQWRRELTHSLTQTKPEVSVRTLGALRAVGAFDQHGYILRDWALGLLTREAGFVEQLLAEGVDGGAIDRLVVLIERHPTPAAGG